MINWLYPALLTLIIIFPVSIFCACCTGGCSFALGNPIPIIGLLVILFITELIVSSSFINSGLIVSNEVKPNLNHFSTNVSDIYAINLYNNNFYVILCFFIVNLSITVLNVCCVGCFSCIVCAQG